MAQEIALGGSYGRGASMFSLQVAQRVETTRQLSARYIGAKSAMQVAFTPGATEALNSVIQGFPYRKKRVVTTPLEHNAVRRPLIEMTKRIGLRISFLPTLKDGRIDITNPALGRLLEAADLCIINHASNLNGALQPVEEIARLRGETPILLDASQSIGALPIDVDTLDIEYLVAPAHKGLGGPTGVAILYCRGNTLPNPLILGGTGSDSKRSAARREMPSIYEQGTLNTIAIAGLQATLLHPIQPQHEANDFRHLLQVLEESKRFKLLKAEDPNLQVELFSLIPHGFSPTDLQMRLERNHGIITRAGMHCAPWAHRHLGSIKQGALRISLSPHHTPWHLERIASAILQESL